MGILTDLFVATEDEILATSLGARGPAEYFPTVQWKNITPLELATLEAIVTGESDPNALVDERIDALDRSVVWERPDGDGDVTIWRVPQTLVLSLTRLSADQVTEAVYRWANTDELRMTFKQAEYVALMTNSLHEICQLAKLAQSIGKHMYLWTSV